jgi:hypothetical protein
MLICVRLIPQGIKGQRTDKQILRRQQVTDIALFIVFGKLLLGFTAS